MKISVMIVIVVNQDLLKDKVQQQRNEWHFSIMRYCPTKKTYVTKSFSFETTHFLENCFDVCILCGNDISKLHMTQSV